PRDALGQSEGSALRVGEVRRLAPGADREDALVRLAGRLQLARVDVDAAAAAVDEPGPDLDEVAGRLRQAGLARGDVESLQRGHGTGERLGGMVDTGFHRAVL